MKKLLVILGSTATGKTDLALSLAKKFNGELVSCDSRQVYRGLDIGTGKMPSGNNGQLKKGRGFWEIDEIKIWVYDVVSPKKQYTVADYVKDASGVVRDVEGRRKLPIIVGGTGFYLKALVEGLSNLAIPVDKKLRKELEQLTVSQLQEKLKEISFERWERLNDSDSNNPRRLVRAIELELGKRNKGGQGNQGLAKGFDILKIGLNASREILYQRSDERVINRIKQGMIEEAERLNRGGLSLRRMRQLGLEYGILADFLDGNIKNQDELIEIMQFKIHGYIRRQLTWFKNPSTCSGSICWFDITDKDFSSQVEKLVRQWYDS